jgi:hypothetical protein
MDLSQLSVLLKSPAVRVFDYNLVVVKSVIIEHVVLAFVVEYHRNFEVWRDNHLHEEVDQVLILEFVPVEME